MRRRPLTEEAIRLETETLRDEVAAGRLYLHEAAKRMRRVLGKTQPEMAQLLGIAQRTYIDFERNVGNPTLETMRRIGCLFDFEVKFGLMETLHDKGQAARDYCRQLEALGRELRGEGIGPRRRNSRKRTGE